MNTEITTLLGIKYPIVQGGMAWVSDAKLASAVSNGGGAGIIGAGGRNAEWVRTEIRKAKELTDKPFGVNVMLMEKNKDEIIETVIKEGVKFVTLGAGNPIPYFKALKAANIKIIPVVPNLRIAQKVEANGADAVVVEGMEAGGHIGTLTTMALLTNIIPHMKIPVIAAGGIADGRGLAAALLMGASGVQIGSKFVISNECPIHPKAKEAIIQASDVDSVVTGYGKQHAVRGLKNTFSEKFFALESIGAPQEEMDKLATGTYRKAVADGDVENGFICVGQSLCALTAIKPAAEIIEELMMEAEKTFVRAKGLF